MEKKQREATELPIVSDIVEIIEEFDDQEFSHLENESVCIGEDGKEIDEDFEEIKLVLDEIIESLESKDDMTINRNLEWNATAERYATKNRFWKRGESVRTLKRQKKLKRDLKRGAAFSQSMFKFVVVNSDEEDDSDVEVNVKIAMHK